MNKQENRDMVIDGNECDCDEDNKCGCSYPNNVREFACGCTSEDNCGCIKFDTQKNQDAHNHGICRCSDKGECDCGEN